ncbi:type I restriction enzyme S subunit [Pseudomonas brassicacearum]|uniref:Type I restriction enzyme S subunit n=1 Tax=Pseudomonas brassicacearum TaxID=930166 RepID=A0AAW8ME41_9PSED|nr:restriction endonuclease subunit S [Pseudomonas brassicacearum]MDR6960361.1 type I restriction enzyme S subunit [Pseudomonas brassicacearum]
MSELPNGWARAQLDELADINPKQNFDDELTAGFVPMSHVPTNFRDRLRFDERNWGEIKKAYTNFKEGDVIFAKVTPCFENGKAALVDALPNGIGAGSSELFVLRPSSTEVSAQYLLALIKSHDFMREGAANMTGAVGLRRVPKQFVENYVVPVPPATEQVRITQKLDGLLTQVDTLKARIDALPALLKRFRQSVLAAAASGRLTEDWRGQIASNERHHKKTGLDLLASIRAKKQQWALAHSDHNESRRVLKRLAAPVKQEYITPIPKNWSWAQLEDTVLMIVDCHNKTAPYSNSGVPLIRTPNIRNGDFVWTDLKFIDELTYSHWSRRCRPETGDIIFTREAPMGEAAIIPKNIRLCLGQRTMLIRPLADAMSAKYLLIALMDPAFRARSEDTAMGTGVRHLRVGDVSNLLIPVPPNEEQIEIVRRVEQLFAFADQLEDKVASAKSRIDLLTQSILAKAFRGELAPQDPNDEPASVLLERIKTQRAAAPKSKRGRKASA